MITRFIQALNQRKYDLTLKEKIIVALPKQGYMLSNVIIHNVYIKYFTDIIGLGAEYVSLVYLIFNIWNYVNNPIFGIMLDKMKYKEKRGKYTYVMRVTFPFMILILSLLTLTSPSLSQWAIFAVLLGGLFLFDTASTFFVIAIDSYIMLIAPSKEDRIDITVIGNYVANICSFFATLIPTLLLVGDGKSNRPLIITMLLLVVILNGIIFTMAIFHLKDRPEYYQTGDSSKVKTDYKTVFYDVVGFLKMKSFWSYFFFRAITFSPQLIYFTVFLYYMDYVVSSTGLQASIADTLPMVVVLVIYPWISKGIKKVGIKSSILLAILPYIIGYVMLYFANSWLVVLFAYIPILMGRQVNETVQYPLTALVIDENEKLTGTRKPGLLTAINSLLFAPISGIQLVIFMNIINRYGFQEKTSIQTAQAIEGIRIAGTLVPIAFVLIGLIPVLLLPMNLKREQELSEYSKHRRTSPNEEE